jgi:hypothetical protein
MAEIVPQAAQTADAYEDRITAAVKMVLVEISGAFGGSLPSSAVRCHGSC